MHVRENSLSLSPSLSLRVYALFIRFSILQPAFFDRLRAFRGNIRIIHRIVGFVVFLVSFCQMAKMANKELKKKKKDVVSSIEHAGGFAWGKMVVIDRARLFCLVSEFEARCGFEIGDQSLKREIFVGNLANDINALIL